MTFIDMKEVTTETEIKKLMEKEKLLVKSLNSFYEEYAKYLRCTSCNLSANCRDSDRVNCDSQAVTAKFNEIEQILNDPSSGYFQLLNDLNANGVDTTSYNARFKQIKDNHRNILKTRRELDEKIKFINKTQDTYNNSNDNNTLSSIYTGIVLSALATSVLYYVFIKL